MSYLREGQDLQLKALEICHFDRPTLRVWRAELRTERDDLLDEIEAYSGYPMFSPDGPRYLVSVINEIIHQLNVALGEVVE